MSRSRVPIKQEESAKIDLTPMLDVIFIMLIFFIVTASFTKERSIDTSVQQADSASSTTNDKPKNILITINSNDELTIDNRRVDISAIRSLITQKIAENPNAEIFVKAHEASTVETYISVADAAREAKVYAISLIPFSKK